MENLDWIAWAAGIIEGEGCLGLYQDNRRPSTYTVKIQVESTDKFVVDKVQEIFGGNIYENNAPSKLPKYKKSWRWLVSNKQGVKQILTTIYPYLSPRRQDKANEILNNIAMRTKNDNDNK